MQIDLGYGGVPTRRSVVTDPGYLAIDPRIRTFKRSVQRNDVAWGSCGCSAMWPSTSLLNQRDSLASD